MSITADPQSQPLQALALANQARIDRAKIKRQLAAAASRAEAMRQVADLIVEPPDEILGMQIGALIAAGYRMGPRMAQRVLATVRPPVAPQRQVSHLTIKRRHEVAAALRAYAGRWRGGDRA